LFTILQNNSVYTSGTRHLEVATPTATPPSGRGYHPRLHANVGPMLVFRVQSKL